MKSLQWHPGAFLVLVLAATAVGQTNAAPAAYPPDAPISAMMITSNGGAGQGVHEVKGIPFSADVDYEFTQVLDGDNHVRRESHGKIFRDGEGRIRNEIEPETPPGPSVIMATITIHDPVAQTMATWHPEALPKSAEVDHLSRYNSPLGVGLAVGNSSAAGTGPSRSPAEMVEQFRGLQQDQGTVRAARRPNAVRPREDLGVKEIEGFMALGMRISGTTPPGKIGNEKPIVKVDEVWWSKDLEVVLVGIYDDPLYGRRAMRLTNIQVGEPDSHLFQIPPDYPVREYPANSKPGAKPAQ